MRANFRAYMQLPPAVRLKLRRRWVNASPGERREMLRELRQRRQRR